MIKDKIPKKTGGQTKGRETKNDGMAEEKDLNIIVAKAYLSKTGAHH